MVVIRGQGRVVGMLVRLERLGGIDHRARMLLRTSGQDDVHLDRADPAPVHLPGLDSHAGEPQPAR